MILRLKRTPGLYLVGFMGSGKTTVGRLLAEALGWHFVDVDDDIEVNARATIQEIFESQGEAAFRSLETAAIQARVRQIESGHPTVLALGGGAFAVEANYKLLAEHGISVWLDCPLELIRERVAGDTQRPLAADPRRFEELYAARLPVYRKADYRVDAGLHDPPDVVLQIVSLPIF